MSGRAWIHLLPDRDHDREPICQQFTYHSPNSHSTATPAARQLQSLRPPLSPPTLRHPIMSLTKEPLLPPQLPQTQTPSCTLRCQDLSYILPGKQPKTILNKINLTFARGSLTALMGPSGAGKTSLLSVLSSNVSPSHVTGSILVNEQPTPAGFKRISAVVPQDDVLLASLTPYESLMFCVSKPQDLLRQKRQANATLLCTAVLHPTLFTYLPH